MTQEPDTSGAWTCTTCGESVDARCDQCWQCGTFATGEPDPSFSTAVQPERPVDFCVRCGYPRRGLDRGDCPECGAEFVTGDMLPVPEADDQEPVDETGRERIHAFRKNLIGAWIAVVLLGAMLHSLLLEFDQGQGRVIAAMFYFVWVFLMVGLPVVFLWTLLPGDS